MLNLLFSAIVQIVSPESALVSEFRAICVEQNGDPTMTYAAADARGWTSSENGAIRVRQDPGGMMELRAAEVDGRLLCIVSSHTQFPAMETTFLQLLDLPYRTFRNSVGENVPVLLPDTIDGMPNNRIVGASVGAYGTMLSFATRVP